MKVLQLKMLLINNERYANEGSRAFGTSFLCLPVVVARAHSFVTIVAWRNTQAFLTTLLTEKHARFVVLCFLTPPCAL